MYLPTSLRCFLVTFLFLSLAGASGVLAQGPSSPILTQTQKLAASEGAAGDELNRIAVDGDFAVFGAPGARDEGFQAGKSYIFEFVGGVWVQKQILLPAEIEAGDSFGNVVAIGGGSVFVFAGDDGPAGIDQGAVYRYDLENGVWVQKSTLFAPDAFQRDQFGGSLSTDGHWLAVGAPGDDDAGIDAGTVYIYEKAGSSWVFRHKIVPTGLGALEQFGSNTSIKGNHLLVSSLGASRVFVYSLDMSTGEFVFQQELITVDGGVLTGKVAVDGSTALVGAAGRFNPGAVYVFKHDGTQWSQAERLTASDGGDPSFGTSLAFDGNVAVIGALNLSYDNVARGGQAYVFERSNAASSFVERNRLQPGDPHSFDFFGRVVLVSNNRVFVGSSSDQNGDGAGAIYVYSPIIVDFDGDGWLDNVDNCPLTPNSDQLDTDGDVQGDVCDLDDDNDRVLDSAPDNCIVDANADQANNDGDVQGDVCDLDDDNDSLLDTWEIQGVSTDTEGNPVACAQPTDCALPLFRPQFEGDVAADAYRKDIYVEIDYMNCAIGGCASGDDHTHEPDPEQLEAVRAAFASAPVDSPKGIALHLFVDEGVRHYGTVAFDNDNHPDANIHFDELKIGRPHNDSRCDGHFGRLIDREADDCIRILDARKVVFHYSIFAHFDASAPDTLGIADAPGNDFMVTLGDQDRSEERTEARLFQVQAGSLMHELGHNLGLCHGGPLPSHATRCIDLEGEDQANQLYKPNYLSVMNYSFATRRVARDRPLDYSRWELPPLNGGSLEESALMEVRGIDGGSAPQTLGEHWPTTAFTYYDWFRDKCYFATTSTVGPIDWDRSGRIDADPVSRGINDWDLDPILTSEEACQESNDQILRGAADWPHLLFDFQTTSDFTDGVHLSTVDDSSLPGPHTLAASIDQDYDHLSDAEDNCPEIANFDQLNTDADERGNECDTDDDNDGVVDVDDDFPADWSPHACTAAPTIVGTNSNDVIQGTAGDDVIHGLRGHDTIRGNGGRDIICGGEGNDRITTENGDDAIDGGDGHDDIDAGGGANYIDGGTGNDAIVAGTGRDIVLSIGGHDSISIGDGNNYVRVGNGNDKVTTGSGDDIISAGGGHNEVAAGSGVNAITGGNGNDSIKSSSCRADINAGGGHNFIEVGEGECNITAGDGNDHIIRGNGNGVVDGGGGHNRIVLANGSHFVTTGNGNDNITDGTGNSFINAGGGHNDVFAGGGDDDISTGNGNDTVDGGLGNDTCSAGAGNNRVVNCEL